ncbi:unnamed protein product, partial [Rotaria sp. Silwood1]
IAESSRLSNISSLNKPLSASTLRIRQPPPQNSLNVSPEFLPRYKFGSGRKFIMKDNHPSIEKLKFEQELKMAISFHRELKRAKEGNEKSLYARHQPINCKTKNIYQMDVATLSNKLNETTGYVVRPNFEEKFRSTKIQEILYSCISDVLGDKKFEQDSCPEWTKASMFI